MIKTATFKKDYRCFAAGDTIAFRPGVNLLVGDQGMGKSTILTLIRESGSTLKGEKVSDIMTYAADPIPMSAFDFEKDNPRIKGHFSDTMDMGFQVSARFASHGQVLRGILSAMKSVEKPTLFIMDEPDASLSPRSAFDLVEILKHVVEKKSCQVLAAVHNPIVITAFPEVLSLEHRRWMPSADFIESQKVPLPKAKKAAKR